MLQNQFILLKQRKFLPLFVSQFLGALNDNLFKSALVTLVTYSFVKAPITLKSEMLVTIAAGLFILPFFLFSAIAGELADRYNKSTLMKYIKFIEMLIIILGAYAFKHSSITLLMLTLFLMGTHSTFFSPLKYSILPQLLDKNELLPANALIETGTFIAILLGTILGALLVNVKGISAGSGTGITLISVLVNIFAILGWFASLYVPSAPAYDDAPKININFVKSTVEMIKYTYDRRDLTLAILGISWFWFIGAAFLAQFPNYAKDIVNGDETVFVLFLTLFTFGVASGSLFCNKLLKGEIKVNFIPLGALGITIFTFDLYYASSVVIQSASQLTALQYLGYFTNWRIMLDLFLIAVCGGIYIVPLYALMQIRSAKEHRSRVLASNNVMNSLFMVLSTLLSAMVLAISGITHLFFIIGVLSLIVTIYICKLLPFELIRTFLRIVLRFIYHAEVHGIENYQRASNRALIIANHTSFIDVVFLVAFLPDRLTFAINSHTASYWWMKPILMLVDAYKIDPTNSMALKSLINLLKQGKKCIIFPEGRITVTGALMKIYEGPGLIADKAQASILPIRIEGAQYSPFSRLRGTVRIRWFPKVTLTILPAQQFIVPEHLIGRTRRHYIGDQLYSLMVNMMFRSVNIHKNLFSSLLDAASIHGLRHVIAEDVSRKQLSYGQLILKSLSLGDFISQNSVEKENVGILLPNTIANLVVLFALLSHLRVAAMLNYSSGTKNIMAAIKMSHIRTVITSRKIIELLKLENLIAEIVRYSVNIIYLEDLAGEISVKSKLKAFCVLIYPKSLHKKLQAVDGHYPAIMLFTSGSEGAPKGVLLSHANIQANCNQMRASVDFNSKDVLLNILPMFHSFGLVSATILPVLSGLKVFLYPSPLHYRIIPEVAYEVNATILFGTNTFLSNYTKYAHPYDFYTLRYIFAGAEKLQEEVRKIWSEKFGVRIFEGYGTTEASPVLASNTPMYNKPGTVGKFVPGVIHRLEAVAGVKDGGRLWVKGPNIMLGYIFAHDPQKLHPPEDGWYDTGDIVRIDEDGFVIILGRAKRFAKIAGEMISLSQVEEYLNTIWPGYSNAAVSVYDAKRGEQLVAITTKIAAKREDIIEQAKVLGMAELGIPKVILYINQMPLLGSGKFDYVSIMSWVKQELGLQAE